MQGMKSDAVGEQQTVHIVDDDAALREALDSLFRSVGYTARSFGSVDAFMGSGCSEGSGCIILDVRLPGISGLDFQAQLLDAGLPCRSY